MMGPTDEVFGETAGFAATDAERERIAAAERAGWVIRRDPLRGEYSATRELYTRRTLGELLDQVDMVEAAEAAEAAEAKAAEAKAAE